jgi:hypothetical protein
LEFHFLKVEKWGRKTVWCELHGRRKDWKNVRLKEKLSCILYHTLSDWE